MNLKEDEVISVYTDGPFVDLCRGPHVPSTGKIQHFQAAPRRRRVLAWRRAAPDAAAHLRDGVFTKNRIPISTSRASRKRASAITGKVGRELDLFMFHHWAPGVPFWTRADRDDQRAERVPPRADARRLREVKTP